MSEKKPVKRESTTTPRDLSLILTDAVLKDAVPGAGVALSRDKTRILVQWGVEQGRHASSAAKGRRASCFNQDAIRR
jgi:hypothetical protein